MKVLHKVRRLDDFKFEIGGGLSVDATLNIRIIQDEIFSS